MSAVTGSYQLVEPIAITTRAAGQPDSTSIITEITVRPMNVGDLRAIGKAGSNQIDQTLALMQRLTSLDPFTIDRMGMTDFSAIAEMVESFLPASLKAGDKPPS